MGTSLWYKASSASSRFDPGEGQRTRNQPDWETLPFSVDGGAMVTRLVSCSEWYETLSGTARTPKVRKFDTTIIK